MMCRALCNGNASCYRNLTPSSSGALLNRLAGGGARKGSEAHANGPHPPTAEPTRGTYQLPASPYAPMTPSHTHAHHPLTTV